MLNVREITLADGRSVTLRLCSKALCTFLAKHGQKGNPPLVAILGASEDYEAKMALFTAALKHPGNSNKILEGAELLDELYDVGYGPGEIDELILDLARDAGLVSEEAKDDLADSLRANNTRVVARLSKLLREGSDGEDAEPAETAEEENPTRTRQS